MIFRNHRSHYSQPAVVRNKFIVNNAAPCPCQCDDCQRRNRMRTNSRKLVVNPQLDKRPQQRVALEGALEDLQDFIDTHLKPSNHARGDDDDPRQTIADLISDDDNPFTPEDEMGLRNLSHATLKEMRRKYLKKKRPAANASDPAFKAMHENSGAVGHFQKNDNFARRQRDIYQRSVDIGNANRAQRERRDNAVTANKDDPAFAAMNGNSLADALRRKGGK